jgi:hypothetical protein
MSGVTLVGYRGCGKSTVAELLSGSLGLPWHDADVVLEGRAGCSIATLVHDQGEDAFRDLEQVVLDRLTELDLPGERCPGRTGVWLEGRKVAAIGVGARRWISQHGLALNVDCALEGFAAIVPCGIADRPVGRLSDWRPGLTTSDVAPGLLGQLERRFVVRLRPPREGEELEGIGQPAVSPRETMARSLTGAVAPEPRALSPEP